MVLLQIPIIGYTVEGGVNYIKKSTPVNFYGKCRVKVCSISYAYSGATSIIPIQLISPELFLSGGNNPIWFMSNPEYSAVYNLDLFKFDTVINGTINIDLRMSTFSAGGAGNPPAGQFNVPPNFLNCILTLDIEKLDEKIF